VDQLPGQFDMINCVAYFAPHPDPIRGIKALADKLAPGNFPYFVRGECTVGKSNLDAGSNSPVARETNAGLPRMVWRS
jgi:hypothetical protein